MDVYEAVSSRQSVRGFLDRPVPQELVTRVLSAARQAPSGGNLQPWHIYVLSGEKLLDLKARVVGGSLPVIQGTSDRYRRIPYPSTAPMRSV